MKDVMVAQSKGGVGKSTLLFLLSLALDDAQVPIAVRDLDPQESVRTWITTHRDDLPNIELVGLKEPITKPAAVCLIDTERTSNFATLLPSLPQADLYLIPATPSLEDIRIAGKTIEIFRNQRPNANLRLVWNKIREGQDDSDREMLAKYAQTMGVVAMRNVVHDSKGYRDAQYPRPRGGWSRVRKSKFYRELDALGKELFSTLL